MEYGRMREPSTPITSTMRNAGDGKEQDESPLARELERDCRA